MHARMAGVSSINAWKSIYYAFKVSIAMVTSALKEIAPYSRRPHEVSTLELRGRGALLASPVDQSQPNVSTANVSERGAVSGD
jgi:hypothetical protein